jgi:beta-carotene hydroxylase
MSMQEERAIAQKYIGDFPWLMVTWGLGGFALWLALWPLAHSGVIPLWLGCIVATITMSACYLPTHEAQHGNIGRPGSKLRWLNELVGHLSAAPWLFPYRLHRAIHLKHHANTNDDQKDPDIYIRADNIWQAAYLAWLSNQPGRSNGIQDGVLDEHPDKGKLMLEAMVIQTSGWIAIAALCWSGLALEVLMIWWIPRVISRIYTPVTLSWAPHHPMREMGRYRDTRGWKSPVGTILSSGMEYHLVHHLFPSIPLNKTPAAYRELKPLLDAEGVVLNDL